MTQPTDASTLLSYATAIFPAMLPLFMLVAAIWVGYALAHQFVKFVRDGEISDSEQRKKKRAFEPIDWPEPNIYDLPKRKNNEPIRIGDDGELILSGDFDDRIEG